MRGIVLAQDVYFLGFPYNMSTDIPDINFGYPFAFIKKGILSAISHSESIFYVDGYNNPGFSGGPVVFKPSGQNDWQIAGMISGFRTEDLVIFQQADEAHTELAVRTNTGIIKAYDIDVATNIIAQNPIGPVLTY